MALGCLGSGYLFQNYSSSSSFSSSFHQTALLEHEKGSNSFSLCKKSPYLEFFWSIFSHIYLSVFSPNAGKYGQENLRIRTLFTQCLFLGKKFIPNLWAPGVVRIGFSLICWIWKALYSKFYTGKLDDGRGLFG